MPKRSLLIVFCTTCLFAFQSASTPKAIITAEIQAALDHIRPASLRGDLSFIASDLLEGRNTPSRGLDIAAEYIAAQFRRAGLEPAGDDGYFQTARMAIREPNMDGFELTLSQGDRSISLGARDAVVVAGAAVDLKNEPIFKLDPSDQALVEGLTPERLNGKVVLTELTRGGQASTRTMMQKLREAKPALLIMLSRSGAAQQPREGQLTDPSEPNTAPARIALFGEAAVGFYDALKPGDSGASVSLHLAAPRQTAVTPRNVIGILRGSDPALKDTYVLVTAHYDHVGMRPEGTPGDRIFNGANDDGSGTVSVMEVARALATLQPRPRRSIVFMTFFGEEKGLIGSQYYAHHPVFPIEKTVAQLNLEQLGRTDDSEGPQVATATVTGFDYSTLTDSVRAAGDATGIKIYKHPRNSDAYFFASDNGPLAQVGVPAHTVGVTFMFPDYHRVGDEWQKVDYDNLAKIDRTVALSLILLANGEEAPRWDESNPKTAAYVKAWKERHH
ncbi:MAG TPA: M28 family peptidase [Bryobacteraceae bacterium]|nr:M28 family peptidase [Bryobacteraceae bacterium]